VRVRSLVVCSSLVLAAGWAVGAAAAVRGGTLGRPLHLPRVAPGAHCPVSSGRRATVRGRPTNQWWTGNGPVYLMTVGGEPAGNVDISQSVPDTAGWFGQKAPWRAQKRYRGPVLIRGARLDAPGALQFAFVYGEHLPALYVRRGQGQGVSGGRFWPGAILVRSAGCYGIQVDGLTFSETIVVRVHG
jgi:hypothetical protein